MKLQAVSAIPVMLCSLFFISPILAQAEDFTPDNAGPLQGSSANNDADKNIVQQKTPDEKSNGAKITKTAPVVKYGRTIGLRVSGVTPTSSFGRAGFQSGDIIKSLNGEPISKLQQVMDIIGENEKISAVVLRKGREIKMDVVGRKALPNKGNDGSGRKGPKLQNEPSTSAEAVGN